MEVKLCPEEMALDPPGVVVPAQAGVSAGAVGVLAGWAVTVPGLARVGTVSAPIVAPEYPIR
jgi:hypothetical protein